MLVVNAITAAPLETRTIAKICGVVAAGNSFLTSTENGDFASQHHNEHWDNHIKQLV